MRVELYSGRDERVSIEPGPDHLTLRLSGGIETDFLTRVLDQLHREALAHRYTRVTLDLTRLDPLDSSAVKALIKWAMRQAELEEVERYEVQLRYVEGIGWQKVSLAAIVHLCPYVLLDAVT
jgi:ABC-type transporter Mla MlaB component